MDTLLNSGAAGMGFAGSAARAGWGVVAPETVGGMSSENPRSFDLDAGSSEGTMRLVRCHYQIEDRAVDADDSADFTPEAGNLFAVINTQTNTVTAQIGYVFDPEQPELFPVRVYILNADGGVVCDCRGSQVVIHG